MNIGVKPRTHNAHSLHSWHELTFAQLKRELLPPVSARIERGSVKKRAHIVYKHFVTGHRQLCACSFPFHQLEKDRKEEGSTKTMNDDQSFLQL